jgi:hypothetical protein
MPAPGEPSVTFSPTIQPAAAGDVIVNLPEQAPAQTTVNVAPAQVTNEITTPAPVVEFSPTIQPAGLAIENIINTPEQPAAQMTFAPVIEAANPAPINNIINVPEQPPAGVTFAPVIQPSPVAVQNTIQPTPVTIENTVNVPETPVNLTATMPAQAAPVVNVTAQIQEPPKRKRRVKIARDAEGKISGMEETE